ncbi:type VI secretion system-associated protein TagO [Enterobacteriaceae bacterium 4M9]|nr:type VI secretion system-associated protein TagO [Enterobacteriaceae bacterium 4M9]
MRTLFWLLLGSLVLATGVPLYAKDDVRLADALACRKEPSPLLRLDCYDEALADEDSAPLKQTAVAGVAWKRAMNQESQRDDRSTAFLLTADEGENPRVILTTPAIGVPPPRPVLMLSCIDNITRLQVALTVPLRNAEGAVVLQTDKTQFSPTWFVRESGYLLESSRGLAGIDEIRRLFGAQRLTLTLPGATSRLVFNINGLAQESEALRKACRW